jgi:anti-sigma factor RsiW
MSHVDDGTLHAYLDGELTPVEVGQLESHLAGCAGCRARLDEARVLIERAARLLGVAVPPGPERAAPPLHRLRQPRLAWRRLRVPLAWAATIVLALGLGWYGGSLRMAPSTAEERTTSALDAAREPVSQTETRAATPAPGRRAKAAAPGQTVPPSPAATGAVADRPAREESDERPAAAPSAPVASNAVVAPQAASGFALREAATEPRSTTWPVIEAQPARDLLGAAPVAIPGYDVRVLRRNPGVAREVVVEQVIAGIVVSLFERPINVDLRAGRPDDRDRAANGLVAKVAANERLARFVGRLRVEISGPLPMDSLSRLLELIRP